MHVLIKLCANHFPIYVYQIIKQYTLNIYNFVNYMSIELERSIMKKIKKSKDKSRSFHVYLNWRKKKSLIHNLDKFQNVKDNYKSPNFYVLSLVLFLLSVQAALSTPRSSH